MPRIAKPRKWKDKFVTEAGGRMKVLCPIHEGIVKARKELAKHLARLEQEKEQGPPEGHAARTVTECADEFLSLKRNSKTDRTYVYYKGYLNRLKKWYGTILVGQVSFSHGNDFLKRLKGCKPALGPVSINHHVRAARAVFNYAVDCNWIPTNPWRRLPHIPEVGRRRIVTDAEFAKLIAECDNNTARSGMTSEESAQLMKDVLRVLRFTALRPGELRKLRWDHLHLDANLIVISAREHKTGNTTSDPKDRIVPFLDDAKAIFERRREKYGHLPRVFSVVSGAEWTDKVFSRRFNRLRKRAGLDKPDAQFGEQLCLYSLRHSRLTEVATKEGWDLHVIAAYAGHSPLMTQRYVHVNKDMLTHAVIAGHRKRTAQEDSSASR